MRRPYQILLPLLSLFLVRVDLTDLYALEFNVEVIKVYDGDTVLIQNGSWRQKLRLARIDAPEKNQPYLNGQKGAGDLSLNCLKRLLGRRGLLKIEGHDLYQRILGDVNGVSLKLVRQGCVALYPYAKFESVAEKYLYLKTYLRARQLKRGLWAYGGITQPKAWRKKNKFRKRNADRR
jgi:endonuclease YncB( thermonuclease family)